MDDKQKSDKGEEKSTPDDKETRNNNVDIKPQDAAGPSRTNNLPGAVLSPKLNAGLSKSEHNIRQTHHHNIITTKDVTNALKSLSFGTAAIDIKTPNPKDLKTRYLDKVNGKDMTDPAAMMDLKKFMASCFKLNIDNAVALKDIPLQSVHAAIGTVPNEIVTIPNVSCNAETECISIPNIANEVIVTSTIEPKLSKGDKKKSPATASERSDLVIAQRDSLSSIGSNVCRICMTRGRERLISPCNCKGSLANVHLTCLERWLNQVGRNHCELCGFSYPAIRTPRYTVVQALRLWFGNPRNRSHLQSDCLIFWLLSTVTAGLLAVCIVGTQYFVIEGNKFGKLEPGARKEEGISHRITETAMDFFMGIVLCGYSVTVYLLWKDHYVMWNRWRRANVNVRLLLAPDTNPVPFAPRQGYHIV